MTASAMHSLSISDTGPCLSEPSLRKIAKAKYQPMRVITEPNMESIIPAVSVRVSGWPGEWLADRKTGTLYAPDSGRCMSSKDRKIVGLADSLKPTQHTAFSYGTQPIGSREKPAPSTPKLGRGKLCGEKKGGAKLTEEIVRAIRSKKCDGSYMLTTKMVIEKFGICRSSVSDVRARKTWGHVL